VLATCANPNCREAFRYLRDGKLFRLQAEGKGSSSEISNPEYFWLCARCAQTMSLRLADERQVVVVSAAEGDSAQLTEADFIPLDRCGGSLLGCLRIMRAPVVQAMPLPRRRAANAS
jgi:hypothetical protein